MRHTLVASVRRLRYYQADRSMWFTNVELRIRLAETQSGKQHFAFGIIRGVERI